MQEKIILILAISNIDARPMQVSIAEVEPDARVIVGTDPRMIEGLRFDEFAMTEAFAAQRSIRMIDAVQRSLRKRPTSTQRGL